MELNSNKIDFMEIEENTDTTNKKLVLNSFFVSIFICANPISWSLKFITGPIIYIIIFSFLGLIINNRKKNVLSFTKPLPLILFILVSFSFAIIINGQNDVHIFYLLSFILFGVSGLIISQYDISIKHLYLFIIIISVLLIPVVANIHFGDSEIESVDTGMWMGVSYGVLRLILAAFLGIMLREFSLKIKILSIIALAYYITIYYSYASRGAFAGMLLFLFLMFDILLFRHQKTKNVYLSVGLIILVFVFVDFKTVLIFLSDILAKLNINIMAFSKIVKLYLSGDLTNGRAEITNWAQQGILQSPIFGNGIGGFDIKYGSYPHNFIYQILYEFGIFFIIPIVYILYKTAIVIFSINSKKEIRVFLAFIFCSGMVELFFSSTYWRSQIFWYFLGILISGKLNNFKDCKSETWG